MSIDLYFFYFVLCFAIKEAKRTKASVNFSGDKHSTQKKLGLKFMKSISKQKMYGNPRNYEGIAHKKQNFRLEMWRQFGDIIICLPSLLFMLLFAVQLLEYSLFLVWQRTTNIIIMKACKSQHNFIHN